MPKVVSLRTYPVAGMDGYAVDELSISTELIYGNRVFCVVAESELEKYQQDSTYTPLRATQIRFPKLSLFKTANHNGQVVLFFEEDELLVPFSLTVSESNKPFHQLVPNQTLESLLADFAVPLRVSKKSSSQRWAVDCGQKVADWLSERLEQKVRLMKAVKHPQSPKHHFTWYTGLHAVTRASLTQLAAESNSSVDELTFRYNLLLEGSTAFAETEWQVAYIGNVKLLVSPCERCGYIGINRETGQPAHHLAVMQTVSRVYENNFGIYLQPEPGQTVTIRVGDEVVAS